MLLCARYAHPVTCFVANPRVYDHVPFLVVPTAVETASATLAQCPDGARETSQIRQLRVVPNK